MIKSVEATFDGEVFRPDEPVELEANTRVRITVESTSTAKGEAPSFLRTALTLRLDGPSDWSANLEDYLYDDRRLNEQ